MSAASPLCKMPASRRARLALRDAAIKLELSEAAAFSAAAYLTQFADVFVAPAEPSAPAAAGAAAEGGDASRDADRADSSADSGAGGGVAAEPSGAGVADEDARVGACLFVASKISEQTRRSRDVVNAVHTVLHGCLLRDSREYWRRKDALLRHEQALLRALGFDLTVVVPHPLLYRYLHALRAPPPVAALAAAIANDSAASVECGIRPPRLVAVACIALAAALLRPALPPRCLPDSWWAALDEVDEARIADTCAELARVYRGPEASPACMRRERAAGT